ncbi:unnamed protein product, partial [Symbiodinium pilosum]
PAARRRHRQKRCGGGEELLTLDYGKLTAVLLGSLQAAAGAGEGGGAGPAAALASDFNVRDARKLYQIAKRKFPDQPAVTVNRARDALRGDVARQVLASKPRSGKEHGRGAQRPPASRLDDFSQNTRSAKKYGLVVTDVFTREAVTRALPNKNAETVARAAAEAIPDLVQDEGNYVVTTDEGNEFRTLEANLPQGVDRNATAVDRTIQTLKKDLAGEVARRGGKWDDHSGGGDNAVRLHCERRLACESILQPDLLLWR